MIKHIISIEKKADDSALLRKGIHKASTFLFLTIFLLFPWYTFAWENINENILIIYHSQTGKTKLVSETLQKQLNANLSEINDSKDRSGIWGFITASIDAFLHKHTPIEPEQLDLSSYPYIVVASPIWSWNLSTPIHTLFEKNRFDGKKLILITTANIHIMKYEQYGEDASFIKRFLRDYLRGKRNSAASEVTNAGGEFVGHYHIETKGKTDGQIIQDTLKFVDNIKEIICRESMNVTKYIGYQQDEQILSKY